MTRQLGLLLVALVGASLIGTMAFADIPPGPRPAPVPAKPAPEMGKVQFNAKPWATVYIDGERAGVTPKSVKLPVGSTHTARFEKGPRVIEREFTVTSADETLRVEVDMRSDEAGAPPSKPAAPVYTKGVRLEAIPWAKVSVNGVVVGTTPKEVEIVPGEHTVVFEKGTKVVTRKVLVEKGKPITLKVDMTQ